MQDNVMRDITYETLFRDDLMQHNRKSVMVFESAGFGNLHSIWRAGR
jgi:hypothetical protein